MKGVRFLLNSDILYTTRLVRDRLPGHLERFARECARVGATIVFPRTALLEVERRQSELIGTEREALEGAYAVLRDAKVGFAQTDPATVFVTPNVPQLFADCGATVEIADPIFEDYVEAERRACLHLSPQSEGAKSDEMRDLVIWMVSLRIAQRDGRAVLVSRDDVHAGERGDEEAAAANLLRPNSIDEAIELLGGEGTPGILVRALLRPIWEDLRAAGLPLSAAPNIRMVADASFVQGESGVASARFTFTARTDKGRDVAASAEVTRTAEAITRAVVTRIKVDGNAWEKQIEVTPNRIVHIPVPPLDERLQALREVLGEKE
jgi:hypothetical protein